MQLWLQNLLVITLVATCAGIVAWQAFGTFFGRKTRLGSCCSKGCATEAPKPNSAHKIVFMPVEMLSRRK